MQLVKADISKSEVIMQLLKELYIELGEEKESIAFLSVQLVQDVLRTKQTQAYLIYNHNLEEIGVLTLTESQAFYAGGKYGVIDEMYIKPGYRSNNLGSQIMLQIQDIARQQGWKRIDVTAPTEERWQRTVEFYKKNGFEFTGPKLKLKID